MNSTLELSVILPAHNAAATIEDQMRGLSLQECELRWELIVVNHKSEDETGRIARRYSDDVPSLRVLDLAHGNTAAAARNFGVSHARGERLAFCDADDVVDAFWVQAMARALESHHLVAGRLDHVKLNSGMSPYMQEFQSTAVMKLFRIPSVVGANFGCSKRLWDQLGGMDDTLPTAEDFEFGMRAWMSTGAEPAFEANAVVYYRHRVGLWSIAKQGFRYGYGICRAINVHRNSFPVRPRLVKIAAAQLLRAVRGIGSLASPGKRRSEVSRLARALGFSIGVGEALLKRSA